MCGNRAWGKGRKEGEDKTRQGKARPEGVDQLLEVLVVVHEVDVLRAWGRADGVWGWDGVVSPVAI